MKDAEAKSAEGEGLEESRLPADPVIEAYKKDVDRTLLRENLKLTPEQRLEELMELQRFGEALRNAPRTEP